VTLTVAASLRGSVAVFPVKSVYAQGDTVTVTAKADSGGAFMGWTGKLSGTTNPLKIVMATDTAVRMEFDLGNHQATVTLDDIVLRQIPSATTAKTNKLPVLNDLSASLPQDSSLSLTLAGRDSDGVIAGYRISTPPLHDVTTFVGSTLRYLPDSGFFGIDSFFVELGRLVVARKTGFPGRVQAGGDFG